MVDGYDSRIIVNSSRLSEGCNCTDNPLSCSPPSTHRSRDAKESWIDYLFLVLIDGCVLSALLGRLRVSQQQRKESFTHFLHPAIPTGIRRTHQNPTPTDFGLTPREFQCSRLPPPLKVTSTIIKCIAFPARLLFTFSPFFPHPSSPTPSHFHHHRLCFNVTVHYRHCLSHTCSLIARSLAVTFTLGCTLSPCKTKKTAFVRRN